MPRARAACSSGVIVMDGGAVDHKVRVTDVGGIMPDADAHAEGTLGLGVFGFLDVRAGDGIAAAVQDLDQRIGAGAAAADEMDLADTSSSLGSYILKTITVVTSKLSAAVGDGTRYT